MQDKPYGGMQGVEKGVVGMLEVIQSDFARLETETSADEAQAKKDYNTVKAWIRRTNTQRYIRAF